jgi:hypothetical protein
LLLPIGVQGVGVSPAVVLDFVQTALKVCETLSQLLA